MKSVFKRTEMNVHETVYDMTCHLKCVYEMCLEVLKVVLHAWMHCAVAVRNHPMSLLNCLAMSCFGHRHLGRMASQQPCAWPQTELVGFSTSNELDKSNAKTTEIDTESETVRKMIRVY